ncbi:MAG TPA: glycosyltransferase, partial [Azospirillaceae bacterium]|nr:glycosyltransferase [Azospirillaceae bacterium]
ERLARRLEARVWRGASLVLPVTAVLAAVVRDAGVPAQRIHVIANGVPEALPAAAPDGAAARRRAGIPDGATVLGFCGFLREWHGLDTVVDLLAGLPRDIDPHLLLVGDGPARGALEARARQLGVAHRVHFTGVVGRDALPGHLAAFDVALQPAVVPYACPLKILEYMALARAIAAPDAPNIRELLEHGRTALLFPPGGLPDAIRRLCRDPSLRQALGAAARDDIGRRHLTWEGNATRIAELAGRLAAPSAPVPLGRPAPPPSLDHQHLP